MRCTHCPCPPGPTCPGERNSEICVKADPTSPNFRPGVRRNLEVWQEPTPHPVDQHAAAPGPGRKLVNFVVATTKHIAAGRPMATAEQKAERLAICQGCEHYDEGRCQRCGCGLEVKAGWADQECPIGKW